MKIKIKYIGKEVSDERQLKALIGLKETEFTFLVELFKEIEEEIKQEEYEKRLKKSNGKFVRIGSNSGTSKLKTSEEKLFFLLSYLKSYPTFDVHGFNFGLCKSAAHDRIHKLLPVLQRLLYKLGTSPKRILKNSEDIKEAFGGDLLDIIVDGTERKHFRHKKDSLQKKL